MVDLLDEKNLPDIMVLFHIMVLFRASVSQTAEKRIFPPGPALNGNIQLVWMVLGQQIWVCCNFLSQALGFTAF